MAEQLNLSDYSYSHYEMFKPIPIELLENILLILDISYEELFILVHELILNKLASNKKEMISNDAKATTSI